MVRRNPSRPPPPISLPHPDRAQLRGTLNDAVYGLAADRAIHFRDGEVALRAGEMFVVPRGREHKPFAARECRMMLVEPAGTVNTGDAPSERVAQEGVWV